MHTGNSEGRTFLIFNHVTSRSIKQKKIILNFWCEFGIYKFKINNLQCMHVYGNGENELKESEK